MVDLGSQSGISDVQKWADPKRGPGSSRSHATSRVPKQETRRVEDARCVGRFGGRFVKVKIIKKTATTMLRLIEFYSLPSPENF